MGIEKDFALVADALADAPVPADCSLANIRADWKRLRICERRLSSLCGYITTGREHDHRDPVQCAKNIREAWLRAQSIEEAARELLRAEAAVTDAARRLRDAMGATR